jgi:virulence factor
MKPLSIGIIGCGYIAKRIYFSLLESITDIEIVRVLSHTEAKWGEVRSHWPDLSLTTSWDEFISSGIKAAFVLTPGPSHFELCDRLLDAGIHIFVEKPPTTTGSQTRLLAQKALDRRLAYMVGFNRRFSPPVIHALEVLPGRKIRLCLVEKHRPSRQLRGLEETYQEDLIHQIDLLRLFCGDLTPIQTSAIEEGGALLSSISTLRTGSNGLGVMLHSRESGSWQERVTIIADEITLRAEMFQHLEQIDNGGRTLIWSSIQGSEAADRGFLAEVNHFFDCIRTGAQPATNGFEAAKTQDLQQQLVAAQSLS